MVSLTSPYHQCGNILCVYEGVSEKIYLAGEDTPCMQAGLSCKLETCTAFLLKKKKKNWALCPSLFYFWVWSAPLTAASVPSNCEPEKKSFPLHLALVRCLVTARKATTTQQTAYCRATPGLPSTFKLSHFEHRNAAFLPLQLSFLNGRMHLWVILTVTP